MEFNRLIPVAPPSRRIAPRACVHKRESGEKRGDYLASPLASAEKLGRLLKQGAGIGKEAPISE
jgi:hypothetical protein